jgi:DNA-binding NarL/FixJ family response regulator
MLMRVLLAGPAHDRARLRALLVAIGADILGEFPTLAAARASTIGADAVVLAPSNGDRLDTAEPLTPREIEVLELLVEGLSNKVIASRLSISDQTVKFHVAAICGKLAAANRTDAVRRAIRRGLVTV